MGVDGGDDDDANLQHVGVDVGARQETPVAVAAVPGARTALADVAVLGRPKLVVP